ncbi:MAG: hypothetical protein AB8I08_34340 [Sandaracinaceae bacterium]
MNRDEFIRAYQEKLAAVESQASLESWSALAAHIDGTNLNYEECLVSMEELATHDTNGTVRWEGYIWEQVHELFPTDPQALEALAAYYIEIRDDLEKAAPLVAAMANSPRALHYRVLLATDQDDLERAEDTMRKLCEETWIRPSSWARSGSSTTSRFWLRSPRHCSKS